MRWRHVMPAVAVALGLLVPSAQTSSAESTSESVPTVTEALAAAVHAASAESVPESATAAPSPDVPIAQTPIDYIAATRYALRLIQYDAHATLRAVMGENRYAHLAPKLMGESRWNCGVNNRSSSAAGLGQTLDNPRRRAFLASHWLGPFTWDEVRGPSCLADVVLMDRLYELCGLGDWTPPYNCLTPRPR